MWVTPSAVKRQNFLRREKRLPPPPPPLPPPPPPLPPPMGLGALLFMSDIPVRVGFTRCPDRHRLPRGGRRTHREDAHGGGHRPRPPHRPSWPSVRARSPRSPCSPPGGEARRR